MNYKHGLCNTQTYRAWTQLIQRCTNDNLKCWKNYGGRGISYDPAWADFRVFLADMGECPPEMSLDRIDNDRGYGPGNCRWASRTEQATNRRTVVFLTHDNQTFSVAEWARRTGIKAPTIRNRLKQGWTISEALTTAAVIGRNQFF